MGLDVHVAADDRTGALEVAAALADRGGVELLVSTWPAIEPGVSVVDLGSRHLDPAAAGERARTLPIDGALAHKIDSTLRGNWAAELAARIGASGRPLMLVPALPALGRTCVEGVVRLDGVPLDRTWAAADPRRGVDTSRPAEALARYGIVATRARYPDDVDRWPARAGTAIVCDASTDDDLEALAAVWRRDRRAILAGSSAAIAAACGLPATPPRPALPAAGPVLVVCGSLQDGARAQLGELDRAGLVRSGAVTVCASPRVTGSVDSSTAATAAAELCAGGRAALAAGRYAAVVVIGGDTAAAWLGDDTVAVLGSVAPGTALVRSRRDPIPVITRAGGFGGAGQLVSLVRRIAGGEADCAS